MAGASPAIEQECVEGYLFHRNPLRLLILRRPPARGRIWVPVSGKVDPTDPSFGEAIRREVAEETGFTSFSRVFSLDWDVIFEGAPGKQWRLHAFGFELDSEPTPALSAEHDAFEWVDPAEAVRRLHYTDNRDAVRRLAGQLGIELPTRGESTV